VNSWTGRVPLNSTITDASVVPVYCYTVVFTLNRRTFSSRSVEHSARRLCGSGLSSARFGRTSCTYSGSDWGRREGVDIRSWKQKVRRKHLYRSDACCRENLRSWRFRSYGMLRLVNWKSLPAFQRVVTVLHLQHRCENGRSRLRSLSSWFCSNCLLVTTTLYHVFD
jgi:hypothetical protein